MRQSETHMCFAFLFFSVAYYYYIKSPEQYTNRLFLHAVALIFSHIRNREIGNSAVMHRVNIVSFMIPACMLSTV